MNAAKKLKAPFPYFGGKSKVAAEIWQRFGVVSNYVEPFYGSGAVLLGRPDWHANMTETVNDIDGMIANFWRALQIDPDAVAYYADWPVNELDLHARHVWLVDQRQSLEQQLIADPDYYDAKVAGWWCWGLSSWIGSGWCDANKAHQRRMPSPTARGGVQRKKSITHGGGRGVNRQLPQLSGDSGASGRGINTKTVRSDLYQYLFNLSDRLRRVRVCCGDWERVLGPSTTTLIGKTAVLLDPPYSSNRKDKVYSVDDINVAKDVAAWAIENGSDPLMRIAVCGHFGEHDFPDDWQVYRWKGSGGFSNAGKGRGAANAKLETIWFSPNCISATQQGLF